MKNKYLVFAGEWFYPRGGINDFVKFLEKDDFLMSDEGDEYCQVHFNKDTYDWVQIVNKENMNVEIFISNQYRCDDCDTDFTTPQNHQKFNELIKSIV